MATVKKIQIPINKVVPLKPNEVFGKVQGHFLPITCDSGVEISVVPEECAEEDQLTGETCMVASFRREKTIGKKCVVTVQVGDREFSRTAVTQPGEDISWTVCLSMDFYNREMNFLMDQINKKDGLEEQEVSYMPPRMESGTFHQAVVVSEGTLVGEVEDTPPAVTLGPDPHSEEETVQVRHTDSDGELTREDK